MTEIVYVLTSHLSFSVLYPPSSTLTVIEVESPVNATCIFFSFRGLPFTVIDADGISASALNVAVFTLPELNTVYSVTPSCSSNAGNSSIFRTFNLASYGSSLKVTSVISVTDGSARCVSFALKVTDTGLWCGLFASLNALTYEVSKSLPLWTSTYSGLLLEIQSILISLPEASLLQITLLFPSESSILP